jgi:anti-anti-sigma factor
MVFNGAPATVTFERSDRVSWRTLAIDGEIDMGVAAQLSGELTALLLEAHSPAFVDLSGVTFMDSTGIHALLVARRAGAAAGTPVVLVAPSRSCRSVLRASGVWDLFETSE